MSHRTVNDRGFRLPELPLIRARELTAQFREAMPINQPLPEVDTGPAEPPNVLVDAVSLGGPSDAKQKPLTRHVLVKDLNKIGTRLKLEHPKTGVFEHKAPMGLYALFDGQSCAGEPGPAAAEFCARNFHMKLLKRLADIPVDFANEASVNGALIGAFNDLDQELLASQPEVTDGCGAAVALLIGERLFTAVLGQCSAILCQQVDSTKFSPVHLGGRQGIVGVDLVRMRIAGCTVDGEGAAARLRHPLGAQSPVSRSLGDRHWKDVRVTGTESPLILSVPDVKCVALRGPDDHPFLLLASSPVAAAVHPQELVDLGGEFAQQPRAACGEIATRALAARAGAAQCTVVEVSFLPPRGGGDSKRRAPGMAGPEPPAKKAKVVNARGGSTASMRLRHILLRYQDEPGASSASKGTVRTRQDAEAVLRKALRDLRADLKAQKKSPKDAMELVAVTSKKFMELCKAFSDCETAKKGGTLCGDLGWLTPDDCVKLGGSFKEVVDVLMPGQFSDIAATDQGLHLVQRVA